MPRPAVFLGRDGVVNRYTRDASLGTAVVPTHPDDFELLPGVGEAVALLNRLSVPVVVVSNQRGIAEGKLTPRLLDAITEKMRAGLALAGARLDGVLYCRHHPAGVIDPYAIECACRKPKPGMLLRAANERNLSLGDSFLVGDSADDVAAGHAAGVTTFLLSSPRCATCAEFSSQDAHPDCVAADLTEAVHVIQQFLAASGKLLAKPPIPEAGNPSYSPLAAVASRGWKASRKDV